MGVQLRLDSMSVILAPFLIIITALAIPALVIFLIGAVLQAFCVIWAPFAGYVCFRLARGKGLKATDHAVFGVVYALLLFAPWLYLTRRMRNEGFSKGNYVAAYILVYAFWLSIMICHCIYAIFATADSNLWYYSLFNVKLAMYLLVPISIGAFLSIKSLKELLVRRARGELYQRLYLVPFAGASATFAIVVFTWLFLYGLYFTAFGG